MNNKIILPDKAGLVGQYLVARLNATGNTDIVVLDKYRANMAALRQIQSEITIKHTDLTEPGRQ
jgi:nucleoside-diphosphate-sugar epimerase